MCPSIDVMPLSIPVLFPLQRLGLYFSHGTTHSLASRVGRTVRSFLMGKSLDNPTRIARSVASASY